MRIHVLFFASLRERARTHEVDQDLTSGRTVGDLWDLLVERYPAIEPMGASVSFAVNQEYADRAHSLRDGDEVALIPPVSGGA